MLEHGVSRRIGQALEVDLLTDPLRNAVERLAAAGGEHAHRLEPIRLDQPVEPHEQGFRMGLAAIAQHLHRVEQEQERTTAGRSADFAGQHRREERFFGKGRSVGPGVEARRLEALLQQLRPTLADLLRDLPGHFHGERELVEHVEPGAIEIEGGPVVRARCRAPRAPNRRAAAICRFPAGR